MQEHNSRLRRFAACTVAAVAVAAGSCVTGAVAADAAPVSAFYAPPARLPAQPGAVVKSEPMPIFATLPGGGGQWPVAAQRVMYTSRTQDDAPVAVSGTYIEPTRPWQGGGPRPTVVIAPGTVGQGTQCAPSIAFSTGFVVSTDPLSMSPNQEAIAAAAWSSMGARVLVTDYIGLGTPGIHTYVNRVEEAHAVLDGARAANRLGGVPDSTPLVLWGYSQGGGATAAAAELQPGYAPDLNLKGTWAGAPPADLAKVLGQVDGTLISGVIGFAINGFVARNPQLRTALDSAATPQGHAVLDGLASDCIGDVIVKQPFMRTSALTVDHRSMLDHLNAIPEAVQVLNEQRIGTLRPSSPVLITSGRNDDTVPYGQARRLASDWCAKGATVTFRTNNLPPILPGATLPNHFGPELIDGYGTNNAIGYLVDRLDGKPVSGCTID
ncbi:lipase family protein [Nocardia coffeae]|uniref:lipase family protein n=1 Tax=Nocardia coffeae TaxID=2873381 RepID=UPI0027DF07B0|nr:lipase family protein [Nocardia coffeae]